MVFVLAAWVLGSCSSTRIRHVDSEEFVSQAKEIGRANSASRVTYLGATASRAYLERTEIYPSFNGRTTLFWIELSELPSELTAKLKSGEDPWPRGWQKLSLVTVDSFVGEYEASSGHLDELCLSPDGQFSCHISNGPMRGCFAPVGSGICGGTWTVEGGVVFMCPVFDTGELVLSMEGATAVLCEGGLLVTAGGVEHRLSEASTESEQNPPAAPRVERPADSLVAPYFRLGARP